MTINTNHSPSNDYSKFTKNSNSTPHIDPMTINKSNNSIEKNIKHDRENKSIDTNKQQINLYKSKIVSILYIKSNIKTRRF